MQTPGTGASERCVSQLRTRYVHAREIGVSQVRMCEVQPPQTLPRKIASREIRMRPGMRIALLRM